MARRRVSLDQPTLFKRSSPRVAVLRLPGSTRDDGITYGLDAVTRELSVNVAADLTPDRADECDVLLCSLTSPSDVMSLVSSIHTRPSSRLIVGGQGAYPFLSWRHLTHRIAFGRAEDAVDRCVLDSSPLPWCYDYDADPRSSGRHVIRQARHLLPGERSVGCDGSCTFCQYRATRRTTGTYHPGAAGYRVVEDRWENIEPRAGNQTTALDGLSEDTRRRVRKPISDRQIVDGLDHIIMSIDGTMRLKVFMIVGYPWETAASVRADVLHLRDVLSRVSPSRGRVMMMVTVTPFSPEPLTAMEDEPANIETRWRDVLLSDDIRCIYDGPHLNAFFLPQIPGPLTLYRRVCVNRGLDIDRLRMVADAPTIDDAVRIGGDIHARGAGARVSGVLSIEQPSATPGQNPWTP